MDAAVAGFLHCQEIRLDFWGSWHDSVNIRIVAEHIMKQNILEKSASPKVQSKEDSF